MQPVSGQRQRAALDLLSKGVLSADSFVISPTLQRRLAPDFLERGDAFMGGDPAASTEFSLDRMVLDLQRVLLAQLMSDGVAARLLAAESIASKKSDALALSELNSAVIRAVWSELAGTGGASGIAPNRRELQREYVNRMAALVLRPAALSHADARSLMRADAQNLLKRLQAASRLSGWSTTAQAHLADCVDTLGQALAANLHRAGA